MYETLNSIHRRDIRIRGYFALGDRAIFLLIQVVFSKIEIFNTTSELV